MYYITEDPKAWRESITDVWIKLPSLLKEVLGYTDEDIQIFKDVDANREYGALTFAVNLTKEQVTLVKQPFTDNNISLFCCEYDDVTKKLIDFAFDSTLGITKQPPKSHYYDKPVISPEQRIDPRTDPYYEPTVRSYNPPTPTTPTITCPYCKSTSCKKISSLSKAGSVLVWGIFSQKVKKQWHCNQCGSEF